MNITNQMSVNQFNPEKFKALKTSANEVVNKLFYGEMLRTFRASQDDPFFGKGPGNSIFVEQLDSQMISAMSKGGRNGIADALLKQLDPNGYNAFYYPTRKDNQANTQGYGVKHD